MGQPIRGATRGRFSTARLHYLHSENEGDHAKRKGRACNLDLILELVPRGTHTGSLWRPGEVFNTDEERYLIAVGEAFLESGTLVNGWESKLVSRLRSEIFVSALKMPSVKDTPAARPGPENAALCLAETEAHSPRLLAPAILREHSKLEPEAIR